MSCHVNVVDSFLTCSLGFQESKHWGRSSCQLEGDVKFKKLEQHRRHQTENTTMYACVNMKQGNALNH